MKQGLGMRQATKYPKVPLDFDALRGETAKQPTSLALPGPGDWEIFTRASCAEGHDMTTPGCHK